MKSTTLTTILTIVTLLTLTTQIEFQIDINHYERWCFKQFNAESTPYHFKVTAQNNSKFEFSHLFKNGTILYKNSNDTEMSKRIDSYAAVSGQYQYCIQNLSDKQTFTILFLTGIQLSDTRLISNTEDSKLIDKEIDNINKVFQEVRQRQLYSMTINEYNMELQKMVSFKSVGFGFLSIAVVLIISFLHYLEIKRVLHNRKII